MPAQTLQTDAFVLLKQPPGDTFQTFTIFAPEHGVLTLLHRVPKKAAAGNAMLDLFDEAAFLLETSNQGRTYFAKEIRLVTRHAGIGRSYDALRLASALASLIARNPVDEESRTSIANLLRTAFTAFETDDRPDIVYLKSLYRFARDEGYPVKEHWFPTLPSADRTAVANLLNRPLAEQDIAPELVARYQRRLEEYLRGHTDLLVGDMK
jgi:recombinational DNA repair protein (RecF pathway)